MSKPAIYVAIPCYNHMNVQCRQSVDQARKNCQTALVDLHYAVGDSMITRVRCNQISEFFVESDAEWFMTIDSDLLLHNVTADDNIFDRLLSFDVDIVGGLYAKKVAGSKFRCASVPMNDRMPEYNTGLIEMQWLSSGCMLVRRSAVAAMIEAEKDVILYHGDGQYLYKPRYALYLPKIAQLDRDGKMFLKLLSEDWAFCLRAQLAGLQIWADTFIRITHMGEFGYMLWPTPPEGTVPVDSVPYD